MKKSVIISLLCILGSVSCASSGMGCRSGNCMDGNGVYAYENGDVYEGKFRGGAREGQGAMKYSNSDHYEGDFKAGLKDGRGVYKWANGDVYKGGFKGGQLDGLGTYQFANDGPIFEATILNGGAGGKGTFNSRNCELKDRSILCELK